MKQRNHTLDAIRVIAIALVVLLHSASALGGVDEYVVKTLGSMGVPLFVMLTGYLMVDREYSGPYIHRFLIRNLLPLFVSFELWNVLDYIYGKVTGLNVVPLKRMIGVAVFAAPTNSSLWFVPMMLGLYLGLPMVSIVIHHLNSENSGMYIRLLAVCVVIFGTLIPTAGQVYSLFFNGRQPQSVINMNVFGADVWGSSCWIMYLLAGFLLKRLHDNESGSYPKPAWLSLLFAMSLLAMISFNLISMKHGKAWDPKYSNIFLTLAAISLFMIINHPHTLNSTIVNKLNSTIETTSKLSFFVYMTHLWILTPLRLLLAEWMPNTYLMFLTCFAISYFGALVIGLCLSKNRVLRKWLLLMK